MPSKDKVIKQYEKDYESMEDQWGKLHQKHRNATEFLWFNKQWNDTALTERRASRDGSSPLPPRPTLVFNILKPFVIKVINGIKKMKPAIKVTPMDSADDVKLAEVRRGIIRSIEKNSGAIPARLHAVRDTVGSGYGFYRFTTDFEDPKSMNQEFKYKTVLDATSVLFDDDSKEPDGSDCKKVIIFEKLGKKQFKDTFNKDWDEVYTMGEMSTCWGDDDGPIISEYWFIEENKETLVSVNGKGTYLSEVEKSLEGTGMFLEEVADLDEEGEVIKRETHSRQVWCYKMAGKTVLEKTKWPGYWIPVFKIEGRKTLSNGTTRMDGLTRDAKPSQQAYNYARNNTIERMALTPKSPYLVPVGGIPKKEKYKWDSANSRNWSNLGWNAYDAQGRPLTPPIRANTVQVDPGLQVETQTAAEEIKAELGMFGSYMGDTSGERSGRAILAGASESQDIIYDFAYNMALTMQHEARVLNEMIPKVLDVPRQVRMVGEDDTEKVVLVNQQAVDERGKDYYYDLKQGKFDISVTVGPSDESKRMETRDGMESFIKGVGPQFTPIFADLLAKEQDFRMADEMAARAKKFIQAQYPGIIEEDDQKQNPQAMQMQQQMQEMHQVMQQMQAENQQLKQDKSIEMQKIQAADTAAEERNEIDIFNAETTRYAAEASAEANSRQAKINLAQLRQKEAEAIRKYRLELAKLEETKRTKLSEQTTDKGRQEVSAMFDGLKSELDTRLATLKTDLTPKETKPPVFNFNVSNQMPGGGKRKITQTDGGYEVTTEE